MTTHDHLPRLLALPVGHDGLPKITQWHEDLARKVAALGISADDLHVALSILLRNGTVNAAPVMGWTKAFAIEQADAQAEECRRLGMTRQLALLWEMLGRNAKLVNLLLTAVLMGQTEQALRGMKVQGKQPQGEATGARLPRHSRHRVPAPGLAVGGF